MAPVPESLTRWLKVQFPTLPIRQTWLAECVEYLQSEQGIQSASELNTQTLDQVLMANLEDVASASALPQDIATLTGQIGSTGPNSNRTSVLVQIVGITDIGVSAQNQIDVLEARRAVKQSPGMAALLDNDPASDPAPTQGGEDHMRAFGEQEEANSRSTTVFQRSMLQLLVSDGHSPPVPAFERVRIPQLSLGTTSLGCKLLLKGAMVRKGQIVLEPSVVTVKGGSIPELQQDADLTKMNILRARINKPPLADLNPNRPPANRSQPQNQAAIAYNVDADEEEALEAIQAEEAAAGARRRRERANNGNQNGANRRPPAQAQAQAQGPAPRRNATPEFDDDDDEIFASIDENDGEVFGVPRNSASGRDGNANGNRNNGWVGHEVIDLSSSP